MITSSQVTAQCLSRPNPIEAENQVWMNTRYLMSHTAAADDYDVTDSQHYNGHRVVPGPKCNADLVAPFDTIDLNILKNMHGIRFTDNVTTEGADHETVRANYGLMSDAEADDFEARLKAKLASTS